MLDRTMSAVAGAISRNPSKDATIKTCAPQAPNEIERTLADRAVAFRLLLPAAAVALLPPHRLRRSAAPRSRRRH